MTGFDPTQDARQFRDALGSFATGVTVVTVPSADGPVGITANSFASVSLDPPLVLWSPAKDSKRFAYFRHAPFYAIHVLSSDQHDVCTGFARDRHAFDALSWQEDENGVPVIDGGLARFDCAQSSVHDAGDHVIIVGRVIRAAMQPGTPLVFKSGKLIRLTT